jgi:hypothetical protein
LLNSAAIATASEPAQRLADQERYRNVGDINGTVMERVDHFVGAAGNWHDDFEIQSFALEEALAISDHDRERVDAAQCGIGCSIT